jgi:hypothetical protein
MEPSATWGSPVTDCVGLDVADKTSISIHRWTMRLILSTVAVRN